MAKVHKSYRMEQETIERVEAWAREHGVTVTQAMEELLGRAMSASYAEANAKVSADAVDELQRRVDSLQAQSESWHDQKAILGANLLDLRQTVATLTAQVAEKDRQIGRLQDSVDHAQVLQAAQVAGALSSGITGVPQDGTQEETQPRGIWGWLARKIEGK